MKTFIYNNKKYRITCLYNVKWHCDGIEDEKSCEADVLYNGSWHPVKNPQILKDLREEYDKFETKSSLYMGETNIMSNGMEATIIGYRKYNDIDVEFEDKAVVMHTTISKFNNGQIVHPTINKKYIDYLKRKEQVCSLDKYEQHILYTYG